MRVFRENTIGQTVGAVLELLQAKRQFRVHMQVASRTRVVGLFVF